MGMRIKKALGYGISFSKVENEICVPNKENIRKYLYDDGGIDDFLKSLGPLDKMDAMTQYEINFIENSESKIRDFYQLVQYDDEFLSEDCIIFQTPLCYSEWNRSSDDIDYYELTFSNEDMSLEPTIKTSNVCLYPYTNLMKKDENGNIEKYWVPCYRDDPELKETAIPYVPEIVQKMVEYFEFVPKDRTTDLILTMRPTLATWFS